MSCLIDSSVIIAYADRRDENHERATQLLQDALEHKTYGAAFISDYIVDECLTFVYARTKNKAKAVDLGNHLISSEFNVLFTAPNLFEKAWGLFKKSSGLSFTDCAIAACMQTYGIEYLLSFDAQFDSLKLHRIG